VGKKNQTKPNQLDNKNQSNLIKKKTPVDISE